MIMLEISDKLESSTLIDRNYSQ